MSAAAAAGVQALRDAAADVEDPDVAAWLRARATRLAARAATPDAIAQGVAQWVAETHHHDEHGTPAGELYARYATWASTRGHEVATVTKWGRTLTDLGHPARRSSTCNVRPLTLKGRT